jgi:hypothetical protein
VTDRVWLGRACALLWIVLSSEAGPKEGPEGGCSYTSLPPGVAAFVYIRVHIVSSSELGLKCSTGACQAA